MSPNRRFAWFIAWGIVAVSSAMPCGATELSVDDFKFDGPLGSDGAKIEKIAANHFRITLGHAPKHTDWANKLYFQIVRNAKGAKLRLDIRFLGGNKYRFNHNACTYSYDAKNWLPVKWQTNEKDSAKGDTLLFPEFTEDVVHFGGQVPMSYEEVVALVERWEKHPHATVTILGKSLGGRNLYRLTITDPKSPHPASRRWCHYVANQHPGEHHSQWRMVGMVDWLLSDAGADCRRRSVSHFVLMMSPDGPSHGWYRVNAQGVDMNRSYLVEGSNKEKQPHEAFVVQRDLEKLMKSETPITNCWAMHTWRGPVEPILVAGPEIGTSVKPWQTFRDILKRNAPADLIEPLKARKPGAGDHWNYGPHLQFGITNILCEGSGDWFSKQRSLDAGSALMKSLDEYYAGIRPEKSEKKPREKVSVQ